ncbi:MAG: helix-turn-helix domain-containing protein [Verrucomicrobia bacterium]|nr:helix-turn-helix domain-containing protein [Verrucomicrobiota bacterium]
MDRIAKYLHYPAMHATVSHSPLHSRLVTGLDKTPIGHHVLRPGGTRDHLLMMTLSGSAFLKNHGTYTPLSAGATVLIPPGVPHDYGMATGARRWEVIWAHFHAWPHWKDWLAQICGPSGARVLDLGNTPFREPAESAFRQMHHDAFSSSPQRVRFAMNGLERVLLICMQALSPKDAPHRDERITRVIEYMAQNLPDPHSVKSLAALTGLSPSRFAHLFVEQMQTTPLQYLEMLRMDRARDLLARTVRPVAEIAAAVGFDEPFYFSRRFRKANSMSPRAFRQAATAGD